MNNCFDHIKFTNQFYEVKSHIISEFSTKGWQNSSFRGEENSEKSMRTEFASFLILTPNQLVSFNC